MKSIRRVAVVTCLLSLLFSRSAPTAGVQGSSIPSDASAGDTLPRLIREMVGTWDVHQRMWPAAGAEAVDLPAAVARRRLVGGAFMEEVMRPAVESDEASFTRIAYFDYNHVMRQYEYFSLDTRAPQMMNERGYEPGGANDTSGLTLYGGTFIAPQWGDATDAAFRYRLVIGGVEGDRQVIRLFLTPQSERDGAEFLAFEYVYSRRR